MVVVPRILCSRCVHHRVVQATNEVYCVRPVELLAPDYVFGTTAKPLAVLCKDERTDRRGGACGPDGQHFVAILASTDGGA